MKYKDYYQVLGIERGASQDAIKRAYRKLARKYHPDVSRESNAEERIKEVNEAYEVLGDKDKRAAYDALGSGFHSGEDFSPPPGWESHVHFGGGGFAPGDARHFSDFFEALFGQGGFGRGAGFGGIDESMFRQAAAPPQVAELAIDLEEAYEGSTRTLTMETVAPAGQGRLVRQPRTFTVKIPAGVSDGQRIRLSGQAAGGGDVYLDIRIRPHPVFRLDGRDVHLELPLAPWEAALGARITAPTPGSHVEVRVPAGTQGGGKLRLKGRGLPGQPPGDLYLTARIVVPPAQDDAQRKLYERMAKEMAAFDPRASWKQHA